MSRALCIPCHDHDRTAQPCGLDLRFGTIILTPSSRPLDPPHRDKPQSLISPSIYTFLPRLHQSDDLKQSPASHHKVLSAPGPNLQPTAQSKPHTSLAHSTHTKYVFIHILLVLLQPRLLHLGQQHRSMSQPSPLRLLLRRLEHRHVQRDKNNLRGFLKLLLF